MVIFSLFIMLAYCAQKGLPHVQDTTFNCYIWIYAGRPTDTRFVSYFGTHELGTLQDEHVKPFGAGLAEGYQARCTRRPLDFQRALLEAATYMQVGSSRPHQLTTSRQRRRKQLILHIGPNGHLSYCVCLATMLALSRHTQSLTSSSMALADA